MPVWGLSKVKGPTGALCQAMGRLGWEMVSPTEFRDAKRYLWDAERHAPASIRWAARRDGADKAWSRTVNRTDMTGLGGDRVDEASMRRMLAAKEKHPGDRSHRVAIMTGAVWTKERLHRAGRASGEECPRCHVACGDHDHLYGPSLNGTMPDT